MIKEENVIKMLKGIVDPEIGMDIYTLGLIYKITITDDTKVHIKMTFTSPTCPFAPQIVEEIKNGVASLGGEADLEFCFDPPWEPSEEVKMELGLA